MTHWNANPIITRDPNSFIHVECPVWGDSLEAAREGAEYVLNTFAQGKLAFIRRRPEARSEPEFDKQVTRYIGYVRFSFKDEPGEWKDVKEPDPSKVETYGFGLNTENTAA